PPSRVIVHPFRATSVVRLGARVKWGNPAQSDLSRVRSAGLRSWRRSMPPAAGVVIRGPFGQIRYQVARSLRRPVAGALRTFWLVSATRVRTLPGVGWRIRSLASRLPSGLDNSGPPAAHWVS